MSYTHTKSMDNWHFQKRGNLSIPSRLWGFNNSDTTVSRSVSGREVFLSCKLQLAKSDRIYPVCSGRMYINGHSEWVLCHLCLGQSLFMVRLDWVELVCRSGHSHIETVPFKAKGLQISVELSLYARDILRLGAMLKQVTELTGLGKNKVLDIDLKRLKDL